MRGGTKSGCLCIVFQRLLWSKVHGAGGLTLWSGQGRGRGIGPHQALDGHGLDVQGEEAMVGVGYVQEAGLGHEAAVTRERME
jgi:hypothetical protein